MFNHSAGESYDSIFARVFFFFFFFFFLPYHLFLHHLENRTKPISTPYDGRRWWDSNLRTPACKSPAVLYCATKLCYSILLYSIQYCATDTDFARVETSTDFAAWVPDTCYPTGTQVLVTVNLVSD